MISVLLFIFNVLKNIIITAYFVLIVVTMFLLLIPSVLILWNVKDPWAYYCKFVAEFYDFMFNVLPYWTL
jgi:hypothetical protein